MEKRKRKKQKARTDKTFLHGVFLSNIYGAASACGEMHPSACGEMHP